MQRRRWHFDGESGVLALDILIYIMIPKSCRVGFDDCRLFDDLVFRTGRAGTFLIWKYL